ncbi:hypothetical protein [Sphingomonas oligophenolica]|uniref:Uncharacterized protein n=1 Tax=Sphingomonas oligophenolica TaxID=301154 RepID=A0A502CGB7_9SPHN|nr:hypothetical protein [Sphingomonas oligophenolica]TPG12207.1 hypothetical protein EAH84_10195 [Sphingomonas oligophenolica]
MKIFVLAAASIAMTGLAPVALAAPATAAQHRVVTRTRVVTHTGPAGHYRYRTRHVCRTHWRHHHLVRVCRNVRYRVRY